MALIADFTYVANGLEIICTDASIVTDPTPPVSNWDWHVTIPGPDINTEGSPVTLIMPSAGTYTVDLSVLAGPYTAPYYEWGYISKPITVYAVSFSARPKDNSDTLTILFTDLSALGATAWLWDFGDSSTSTVQNPVHQYAAPGTYVASLTVDGHSYTSSVIVEPPSPQTVLLALANDGHIIKSTDSGDTWVDQGQKVSPYDMSTHGLDVSCGLVNFGGGILIAFTGHDYIERSVDYGETWSTLVIPYLVEHGQIARAGASLGMGRGLLAGFWFDPTCDNMLRGSILLTLDYGLTWTRMTNQNNLGTYLAFSSFAGNRYVSALRASLFGACGAASDSKTQLSVSVTQGGSWVDKGPSPLISYSIDTPNSLLTTMLPDGKALTPRTRTSLLSYEPPYDVITSIDPNKVYDRIYWSKSGKLFASSGEYEDVMEFTPRTTASGSYYGIAYGNGIFVAVGRTSTVLLSVDGIDWYWGAYLPNTYWYNVVFGNGLFVAASGISGVGMIYVSTDGVFWTEVFAGAQLFGPGKLAYGNGIFVATDGNVILVSSDGYSWNFDPGFGPGIPFGCSLGRITYGSGKFVTLGRDASDLMIPLTSTNGFDWDAFAPVKDFGSPPPITFGNGLFVALSTDNDGYSTDLETVMISSDGETWTLQQAPETNSWYGVFYGNGLFVGLAGYKTHSIMTSPNGINWTIRSETSAYKTAGVYAAGLYVIACENSPNAFLKITTSPGPVVVSDPTPTLYRSSDRGASFDSVLTDYETWTFCEWSGSGTVVAADFSADPLAGPASLTVQFTDLSTGGPTSWDWNFGDGTPNSTEQNPSHIYTVAGVYTVTLSVDSGASTETKIDYITVNLAADFVATVTSGRLPLSVKFVDRTIGEPTAWDWDFGDSTLHSTQKSPTHIYVNPGVYTVTLVAFRGSLSDTEIKIGYILVFGRDVIRATEDIAVPEDRQDLRLMYGTSSAKYILIRDGIRVAHEGIAGGGGFSRPQGPAIVFD
jgi:PKD repeat protein